MCGPERWTVDVGDEPGAEPWRPSHLERAHEEIDRDQELARRVEMGDVVHDILRDDSPEWP
jgi:hypothetical protein